MSNYVPLKCVLGWIKERYILLWVDWPPPLNAETFPYLLKRKNTCQEKKSNRNYIYTVHDMHDYNPSYLYSVQVLIVLLNGTHSVIWLDCISLSNTSIATKGLFSTKSGNCSKNEKSMMFQVFTRPHACQNRIMNTFQMNQKRTLCVSWKCH